MIVLILFTISVLLFFHWLAFGTHNFWKKRNVPFPPPQPIFGNVTQSIFLKRHVGEIYKDIYNSYKDCLYVGIFKIRNPAILLRDIHLMKEIMTKEFQSFHDNDIHVDEDADPLFGRNPFVLKGQKWKVIRGYVTSAITSGKIKQMSLFMTDVSKKLVNYLKTEPDATNGKGLDSKELCVKFTTDVVAACAFGLDGKSFIDPNAPFRVIGQKLFTFNTVDAIKAALFFISPSIVKFLKLSIVPKDVNDFFIKTLTETIKYRKENNIVRNDYLDLMLSLKSKPAEFPFTDMDVMAQAMTFYVDGMETSATSLSYTLYEIAKNPEIQEKLKKEVESVLKKYDGEIVYEAIQEMQYLDMCILESLRKYPPAMFLMKLCTKTFTLPPPKGEGTGSPVVIEPNTSIIIPIYAIHHDPQFYPNPEEFIPERFSEEEKKNRDKCIFMPFGEGPRMCLGFRFALIQMKIALAATVLNFELKVNPKTTPEMIIDPAGIILTKSGGMWLDFCERK